MAEHNVVEVPLALFRDPGISPEAKVVFALLAVDGCSPGIEWIATHTPACAPTVSKAIRELAAKGWIRITRRNRRIGQTDLIECFSEPRVISPEEGIPW